MPPARPARRLTLATIPRLGRAGSGAPPPHDLFAWFASTASKSRLNFLELLRGGHADYVLSAEAFAYLRQRDTPPGVIRLLEGDPQRVLATAAAWQEHLDRLKITDERPRRLATEGALFGSVLAHGVGPELVIVSDDAAQFHLFRHGLCGSGLI